MKLRARRIVVGSVLAVQVFFYPMTTFADTNPAQAAGTETSSSGQSQTPTDQPAAAPVGPEAAAYVYNPATGLWESQYYTWDPATKQTAPKHQPVYIFNPATKMWETTIYVFDVPTATYVPQHIAVTQLPAGAITASSPSAASPQSPSLSPTSANASQVAAASSNSTAVGATSNNTLNSTIRSSATSGDASVIDNTTAGDAITGDATAMANVLNLLQSSYGIQPGSVHTFTTDIYGTHFGDIHLDPNLLPAASGQLNVQTHPSPLTVTVGQNNTIVNDISLTSTSGDALIDGNTNAGNAISGDALAVANVVNMINSSISTGQSFIGNINIRGDLDGDILLPDSVKEQLLSGNAPTTTVDASQIKDADLVAKLTTNTNITNNVNTTARSGDTQVTGNTTGGDAQSGDADANLTVLNLTGQQVIGKNALLVFVNVMGKWVGAIMNAPAGSTSATVGDASSSTGTGDTAIDGTVTNTIKNNINVSATSGDATVSNNTHAGNATSGAASASANVANITNSSFSLADWFGILFINVFGSWDGSFGTDTAAGGMAVGQPSGHPGTTPELRAFHITATSDGEQAFIPIPPQRPAMDTHSNLTSDTTGNTKDDSTPKVLAASSNHTNTPPSAGISTTSSKWPLLASFAAMLIGLALITLERAFSRRKQANASTTGTRHAPIHVRPGQLALPQEHI